MCVFDKINAANKQSMIFLWTFQNAFQFARYGPASDIIHMCTFPSQGIAYYILLYSDTRRYFLSRDRKISAILVPNVDLTLHARDASSDFFVFFFFFSSLPYYFFFFLERPSSANIAVNTIWSSPPLAFNTSSYTYRLLRGARAWDELQNYARSRRNTPGWISRRSIAPASKSSWAT